MFRSPLFAVMCVGYFLVLLDVTVVNVALPELGRALGAGATGLSWVVDGYALALAGLLLAAGTVGDGYGHKRVVLAGLAVFGLASLACGLAPGAGWLVGARFGQGVGAALLLPGTLAVLVDAFPAGRDRARAIGVWAGVGSVALPAGPVLGGLLVAGPGWRWVFLLNVPIVAVALVVTARSHIARHVDARPVDWAGAGTGTAALGVVMVAVIEGVWWLLAPAAVLLAVFVVSERRTPDPVLPLTLFRRPAFTVANTAAGVMNLATLGLLFLVTQYLQTVRHESAATAGIALLPLFLPLSVLAPVVGRLVGRVGPRRPMAAGLAVAAAGFVALTAVGADSPYGLLLAAFLLWGTGLAVLTPSVVAAAVGAAGRSGLGAGVNNTARQAGGAVGVAAFGAIAGPAAQARPFLAGLHLSAAVGAALFLVTALAVVLIRLN